MKVLNASKKFQWLLLPACLLIGLALMITFVSISQNYLSDYLVQNSKDHIGQKLDPAKVGELIGRPEMATSPQPSVLVFWSLTCAPCLEKLKDLPDLGRGERLTIPINTDNEQSLEEAKKILAELVPNQPFYHDRAKTLMTELELDYLPTNVYIDADGIIERIVVGEK